jgi:AcrR family transcriptional regulator
MVGRGTVSTRDDQGRATRGRLVDVATGLFGTLGYEATSTEAVLAAAGVSRGSLYYHFKGKEALFEAVLEAVEERIGTATIAAAAGAPDTLAAVRAGCMCWIQLAGDPVVQRIVLVDAVSVLGWQRSREIQQRAALGVLAGAMQVLVDEGGLPNDLADIFAHIVFATMCELAIMVVQAEDPAAAQLAAVTAADHFLTRLLHSSESPEPPTSTPSTSL